MFRMNDLTPRRAPARFDRREYPAGFAFRDWHAADGWRHRAFRWPAAGGGAPRGSLLFQSGRADFIEKYLETCHHFHTRGWDVEGFDWRGQGGSGRLFPGSTADDRDSFDALIGDLAEFVADWRARTPGPHVVVAHSMGGHIAMRALPERGVALDALVLVAPMLGVNTGRVPPLVASGIIRSARRLGLARQRAWRDSKREPRRQLRLTADRERYLDSQYWKARLPHLASGPPSWGWLNAALDGIATLASEPVADVTTPVLLLMPGLDRLVDPEAAAAVMRRLPDSRTLVFPNARHELLREVDAERDAALAAIDAFLDERAPLR